MFKSSKINFVILVVLFRIILDISYYKWVYPQFYWYGLLFAPGPIWVILLSYAVLIATACLIDLKTEKPSRFMIIFLYLVSFVPATSLIAFGNFPVVPALWLTAAFVLLLFLSKKKLKIKAPTPLKESRKFLFFLILGIYFITLILLFIKYGLKTIPTLDSYIIRRLEFIEVYSGILLANYGMMWLGAVIIPFIGVWAVLNRRTTVFVIAIISQLFIYSIGGYRTHLFVIPFIAWLLLGLRFFRKKFLHYTLISLILFCLVSDVADYSTKTNNLNTLFTRRVFFVPSQAYFYYYDFFSHNPHTYLSERAVFNHFIKYPYPAPVPYIIGATYFSDIENHANGNMWADAYSSLGIIGMFLFTLLLWILMEITDRISERKNIYLVYAVIAMPLFSLTNTSLLTTILTHGLLIAMIIIYLLPKERTKGIEKGEIKKSRLNGSKAQLY